MVGRDQGQPSSHQPILSSIASSSMIVSDIASSSHQLPVQPILGTYPVTKYGNKDCSLNSSWYSKFNWLEYSVSLDTAFCFPCRFFAHGSSKAEDRFVTLGYKD